MRSISSRRLSEFYEDCLRFNQIQEREPQLRCRTSCGPGHPAGPTPQRSGGIAWIGRLRDFEIKIYKTFSLRSLRRSARACRCCARREAEALPRGCRVARSYQNGPSGCCETFMVVPTDAEIIERLLRQGDHELRPAGLRVG
jgi:hypothetical protein